MIYAELRREGGEDGYYTLRYLVWNGDDMIGSYGVHFAGERPYGASRDFHKLASERDIEQVRAYRKWADEDDYEGDMPTVGWGTYLNNCPYHDNKPCICDGSSLVEVIVNDDERAFMIAAMMADIEDREVPPKPVHEHDCDHCAWIGSYRLKHPYVDEDGYRTGIVGKKVDMADVYLACDNSGYKYIVRYGRWGEYATTNTVSHYALAPMVDGVDINANMSYIFDNANDPLEELSEDIFNQGD